MAASSSSAPSSDLPRWPLLLALGLTLAVVAGLAAFAAHAHWQDQQSHQRIQRLEALRSQILRYDEALTLAARLGAESGAFRWQRRYTGDEARLQQALDAAIAATPSLAGDRALQRTRQANQKLVALERQAFALARAGRFQAARARLTGPPYRSAKAAYKSGLDRLRRHLHEARTALLGRAGEGLYRLAALGGAALLVLAGVWGVVFRLFYRNRDHRARYWEQLLASLGEGVFEVDHRGRFTFLNPAARQLFGFTSEDTVLGQNSHQLTHHTDAEGNPYPEVESPIYRVMATGQPRKAWRDCFWRADGVSFPVEVSASPIGSASGPTGGVVVVFRDITERQERERVLQKYRAVFEQSRDAIMLLDRGRFLDPNPAALKLFRLADEFSFQGYHPADLSPTRQPDGRPTTEIAQERIEEAFNQGEAFFEWRHRTVDGEEFPAEVFLSRIDLAERTVLQAVVRDISERKAMERSFQRYRAAFEQSRDAVMFLDRDGYMEGNPATLTLFGVESNEVFRERHPADLSPPYQPDGRPSPEAAQARIREAFNQGQAFFEWRHRTWDGQDFPTEVLLSRIDQEDQALLQVVVRDISERKEAGAKLRERIKELRTLRDIILLTTDDERPLQALLDECARRLPAGWTEPEHTAVRIRAGDLEAVSEPFFESDARQEAAIDAPEAPVAVVVFHAGFDPTGAFLPEEQDMLDSVAQQIHNALLRRQAQQELERLATHDQLTGIYNRTKLYELLETAREEHNRYGTPFSVIMFDIDHFKAVNDTYGHSAGDAVLRELTARVQRALRETDALSRWGGEEFLILAGHADRQGAGQLAERIRQAVAEEPFAAVGAVTVSLGVAEFQAGENLEHLEERADEALYEAKGQGRNRIVIN